MHLLLILILLFINCSKSSEEDDTDLVVINLPYANLTTFENMNIYECSGTYISQLRARATHDGYPPPSYPNNIEARSILDLRLHALESLDKGYKENLEILAPDSLQLSEHSPVSYKLIPDTECKQYDFKRVEEIPVNLWNKLKYIDQAYILMNESSLSLDTNRTEAYLRTRLLMSERLHSMDRNDYIDEIRKWGIFAYFSSHNIGIFPLIVKDIQDNKIVGSSPTGFSFHRGHPHNNYGTLSEYEGLVVENNFVVSADKIRVDLYADNPGLNGQTIHYELKNIKFSPSGHLTGAMTHLHGRYYSFFQAIGYDYLDPK